MAEEKTIAETIAENAGKAKKVQTDAGSVENQSISELIKADKYLASKQAVNKTAWNAVGMAKFSAGGGF